MQGTSTVLDREELEAAAADGVGEIGVRSQTDIMAARLKPHAQGYEGLDVAARTRDGDSNSQGSLPFHEGPVTDSSAQSSPRGRCCVPPETRLYETWSA